MKKFKLFILPLLPAIYLYADSSSMQIPKNIETKLCKKLINKECNNKQILESDYYFNLDKNRTLFFFHIYQKDGQYQHGYKNLSAVVDGKKEWKVSNNIIYAEIQEVVQDPKGGVWLRTLWMIEGVSPYLYYSKNAIDWRSVPFPKKRESAGPFENLKLCFLDNNIELTFGKLDHKKSEKTWSATYMEASSKEPKWNALNYSKSCPNIFEEKSDNWSIEKNKDGFKMVYTSVEMPEMNKTNLPYSIQLGAFNHKDSLNAMKKSMSNLNTKLIDRELMINDKKKYKLFLDSYSDYDSAKKRLEKLKRMYTKNKIIQGAYVTKLP
jgi:hypothetical protein